MNDVIIAVIPAPGHEGLVADGPMGERPALLVQTGDGHWIDGQHVGPFAGSDVVLRALVLHAPGGPRLGMVRARAACQGDPQREEVDQFINALPFGTMSEEALGIWCFAHLMRVRGLASEVLVLPVPA